MTISSVTEMWSRSSGTHRSSDGIKYFAEFTSAYQVVHDADESRIAILNDSRVPQLGEIFNEGSTTLPAVYCVDRQVNQITPLYSIVEAQWSGEVGEEITEDPLNAEPEITRGNVLSNEPIDQDFYGFPLTNSVGDPVEGLTTEISDFVLTVRRNFATVNPYLIREYLRSHSSDAFDGWPPGSAKFRTYEAREVRTRNRRYQEVTAKIYFREAYNTIPARAWWLRYRNEGMREIQGVRVTFSGGGGSGATGYAITNASNEISKIVVTNGGSGYTSVPSLSITSDNGSGNAAGSGAAGTITVNSDGEVESVTVTNGGSNYYAKLIVAKDDSGYPVNKPVPLALNGTRLTDASEGVWIERPISQPLPYGVLGLLD